MKQAQVTLLLDISSTPRMNLVALALLMQDKEHILRAYAGQRDGAWQRHSSVLLLKVVAQHLPNLLGFRTQLEANQAHPGCLSLTARNCESPSLRLVLPKLFEITITNK
eukprot:scaffold114074_cov17-Prasinocladus_malaysianus.AAC.1